jgi:pimeloyl-ACP methyl ester carboxylesterase
MQRPEGLQRWRDGGRLLRQRGHRIFVHDSGPRSEDGVLILHGFPSSCHDWAQVVPRLDGRARVVAFDLLGYGLSDKPEAGPFSLFAQADLAEAVAAECGLRRCVLVSHDVGQTVAAELMARQEAGQLPFEIRHSIVTNGSTLVDLAQLSAGQRALLALPDAPLAQPLLLEGFRAALRDTFSKQHPPSDADLDCMLASIRENGGDRLLPRLIRYVEERRANLARWSAALTGFSAPLSVFWGEQDPIAVPAMAQRIRELRPATDVHLWPDVGHWPPLEVPERMAEAIRERL